MRHDLTNRRPSALTPLSIGRPSFCQPEHLAIVPPLRETGEGNFISGIGSLKAFGGEVLPAGLVAAIRETGAQNSGL